jgi:hypothetical protein
MCLRLLGLCLRLLGLPIENPFLFVFSLVFIYTACIGGMVNDFSTREIVG